MLKSENAPAVRLGVRRSAWARPELRRARDAARRRGSKSSFPPAIRSPGPANSSISSGRRQALEDRRAGDAAPSSSFCSSSRSGASSDALLIMATLPFALVGGFWLMYLLGYNMSIASAVGFIALGGRRVGDRRRHAGLHQRRRSRRAGAAGSSSDRHELVEAIVEGAALRVRPIAMTVAVIIAGLLPIMWGSRHGIGGHAPHRRADGRRHDHGAAPVDVRAYPWRARSCAIGRTRMKLSSGWLPRVDYGGSSRRGRFPEAAYARF